MSSSELRRLRLAALLHDIGELGISNLSLDKPGRLTEAERVEIERHPIFTRELLSRVAAFRELADAASDHHEKLDGSGYPRGLCGEELTQTARILAVADIFEAMTAVRPYRGAVPTGTVLDALAADAGRGSTVAALPPYARGSSSRRLPDPSASPIRCAGIIYLTNPLKWLSLGVWTILALAYTTNGSRIRSRLRPI